MEKFLNQNDTSRNSADFLRKKRGLKVRLILGAAAISATSSMVLANQAKAEELWDPYLRGVNIGVPMGALPPPGVYGTLDNYALSYSHFDNSGHKQSSTGLTALIEIPLVLWVPGIKFLGADYAAGIAIPFDYTSSNNLSGTTGAGNLGLYNTILIPGVLSWALPENFHVSTGFEIYLPDASNNLGNLPHFGGNLKNGGMPSGLGYTAVQPDFAISWLDDGWNLTISTNISLPITTNTTNSLDYRSGDEFSADYTAIKTVGNWTFGLGASQQNQLNSDNNGGVSVPNSQNASFALGPVLGYQFGTVGLQVIWNHNIYTKNEVAGDFVNFRLSTKF